MPRVKFACVSSFSSEDKDNPASNLLADEVSKKRWLCEKGEPSCSVVLQLTHSTKIASVTVGAYGAALVEVLVGRSENIHEFEVLVPSCIFTNPVASRRGEDQERVRSFSNEQLAAGVRDKKWDRVRVVCSQPYNRHISYGLCFIHVSEIGDPPVKNAPTIKPPFLAGLDEISSDEDQYKPGELFTRYMEKKANDDGGGGQSTSATDTQIRRASSQALKNIPETSTHLVKTPISNKPKNTKDNIAPKCDEKSNRDRNKLMYKDDDEEPHAKIDRVVDKYKEGSSKEELAKREKGKLKRDSKQRERYSSKEDRHTSKDEKHSAKKEKPNSKDGGHSAQEEKPSAQEEKPSAQEEKHSAQEQKYSAKEGRSKDDGHSAKEEKHRAKKEKHRAKKDKRSSKDDGHSAQEEKHGAKEEKHSAEEDKRNLNDDGLTAKTKKEKHSAKAEEHSAKESSYKDDGHSAKEEKHRAKKEKHRATKDKRSSKDDEHSAQEEIHSAADDKHRAKKDKRSSKDDEHSVQEEKHSAKDDKRSSKNDAHSAKEEKHSAEEDKRNLRDDGLSAREEKHGAKEDRRSSKDDKHSAKEEKHSAKVDKRSSKDDGHSAKVDKRSSKDDGHSAKEDKRSSKDDGHSAKEEKARSKDDRHSLEEKHSSKKDIHRVKLEKQSAKEGTHSSKEGKQHLKEDSHGSKRHRHSSKEDKPYSGEGSPSAKRDEHSSKKDSHISKDLGQSSKEVKQELGHSSKKAKHSSKEDIHSSKGDNREKKAVASFIAKASPNEGSRKRNRDSATERSSDKDPNTSKGDEHLQVKIKDSVKKDEKHSDIKKNTEKDRRVEKSDREKSEPPLRAGPISSTPHTLMSKVVFTISGYENPRRADVRSKALAMGAKYERNWNSSCTHLVCAYSNTPKLKSVRALPNGSSYAIVKAEWIEECCNLRRLLPWKWHATEHSMRKRRPADWEAEAAAEDDAADSGNEESEMDTDDEIERVIKKQKLDLERSKPSSSKQCDKLAPKREDPKKSPLKTGNASKDIIELVKDESSSTDSEEDSSDEDSSDENSSDEDSTDEDTTEEDTSGSRLQQNNNKTLPNFFDGYVFVIHRPLRSSGYCVKKLTRYIKAYGGDVVKPRDVNGTTVVNYIICENIAAARLVPRVRGARLVMPGWIKRCHQRRRKCSTERFLVPI